VTSSVSTRSLPDLFCGGDVAIAFGLDVVVDEAGFASGENNAHALAASAVMITRAAI
jgi:hypothetical protein